MPTAHKAPIPAALQPCRAKYCIFNTNANEKSSDDVVDLGSDQVGGSQEVRREGRTAAGEVKHVGLDVSGGQKKAK